jgi:predicted aspartyl protease
LVDSGCEVELVLSRRLADKIGVDYSLITREVSLPDGTRMAAARTPKISVDITGSQRDLTAVVVDMVAFNCILGYPGSTLPTPLSTGSDDGYYSPLSMALRKLT